MPARAPHLFFAQMKVLLGVLQVQSSIGPTYSITWPEGFASVASFLGGILQFELPFYCFGRFDFQARLLVSILMPAATFLALLAYGSAVASCGATKHASTVFSWAYEFVFWIYPGVSGLQFRTFVCQELDDGTRFLREDPSVDCDTSAYESMKIIAAFGIALYTFGVPAMYVLVVHRYQLQLSYVRKVERFLGVADAKLRAEQHDGADDAVLDDSEEGEDEAQHKQPRRLRGLWALLQRGMHRHGRARPKTDDEANGDTNAASGGVERVKPGKSPDSLADAVRDVACEKLSCWFSRFGIELDPTKQVPTVKTVWPVYKLVADLTPHEEELAFARYQQNRYLTLRAKGARMPLQLEEETLFLALCHVMDKQSQQQQAEHQLKPSTGSRFSQNRANLRVPCKAEWERMSMRERSRWILDDARSLPEVGETLVAVDGQLAPHL